MGSPLNDLFQRPYTRHWVEHQIPEPFVHLVLVQDFATQVQKSHFIYRKLSKTPEPKQTRQKVQEIGVPPSVDRVGILINILVGNQCAIEFRGGKINQSIVCQRGGVSNEPPWLRAATRHGPGTL